MAVLHSYRSTLAGSWYPREAGALREMLAGAEEKSAERTGEFVRQGAVGFIVPHAGPAYSGVVASAVYRHVKECGARRVVLLGFSHRRAISGIAMPDVEEIETPLGAVQLDRSTMQSLGAAKPFHLMPAEEASDHSVEVQLPFLQTVVPEAEIVPLYVGHLQTAERRSAATALRELVDGKTVLIASSDLTHYGRDFGYAPFPPDLAAEENLREIDTGALSAAASLDPTQFEEELKKTGATVCGRDPIGLLLETVRGLAGDWFAETLDYQTSGEITGDFGHSVSYGAMGIFPAGSYWLGVEDQRELLESARFTLDQYRRTGEKRVRPLRAGWNLRQKGRAFVTLYAEGEVRGCVGCFENPVALWECVPRLAASAMRDGRFGGISSFEEVEIEVHVLTPPRRIQDPKELHAGHHGGFLTFEEKRGLLLPAVASRHGMTTETFLRELARKAGVATDVYHGRGWELSVFCDQSFVEPR
jgi:hypothetical protein